jgi:ABC-type multidrug transport system fused ATPase/permease subunit
MASFRTFKQLLRLCLEPRKRLFLVTLVAVLGFNFLELAIPKLLQLFVDSVAGNHLAVFGIDIDSLNTATGRMLVLPSVLLGFAALRWAFTYIRSVLQTRLGQGALFDLRGRIFNTMQNLSFAYHDSSHSGTLISNVVEDVNYASMFFQFGIFPLLESAAYAAVVYGAMIWICPSAAVASLALLSLSLVVMVLFFRYGQGFFSRTKELFAEIVQLFTENIEGHLVVRAFGCRMPQRQQYRRQVWALQSSTFKERALSSVVSQAFVCSMTFGIPAVLGAALMAARQGRWTYTPGSLFFLFYLQSSLVFRSRMFTRGLELLMRFLITGERLDKLFSARDYLDDSGTLSFPDRGPEKVKVEDVSFAYGNRISSLKNVSLELNAGETIGFVGSTGSGKTTLALLLCRFYDPTSGRILIDGRDMREYSLNEIRDQSSLVFQQTFLFSASVRDNIAYGKPDAAFEEIVNAATLAQAHEFIMEMPDGYDTMIGEKGVNLSGGQRQRISIARAILRRPRFLILDASTSAVDPLTEKAIQSGLRALGRSTTKIIIAHRFSSIAAADRAYVLHEGRIVEAGTPEELEKPGTMFSKILRTQEDGHTDQ